MTIKLMYSIQADTTQVNLDRISLYSDKRIGSVSHQREKQKTFNTEKPPHPSELSRLLNALRQILFKLEAIDHRTNCILNLDTLPEPLCLAVFL